MLSGGERSRVALAKLLLRPTNLLLLDEPTNHLDIESSEALIEALAGYGGTLLFVSHNRSFVNRLATVVWEVKDGGVLPCPGNLDDWLYHQRQLAEAAGADAGEAAGGRDAGPRPGDRDRRRAEAEARNVRYRLEKPLRDRIQAVEARVAELERVGAGGHRRARRPGHLRGLRAGARPRRGPPSGPGRARPALRGVGAALRRPGSGFR